MLALATLCCVLALADDPVTVEAKVVKADAAVSAVTLYQGSAAVTRSEKLTQAPGVYELRFGNLPSSVQAEALQARVEAPAKLLDVRYEEVVTTQADVANSPELASVRDGLEAIRLKRVELAAAGEVAGANLKALDAIVAKMSQGSAREAGTPELDTARLGALLAFLTEQRATALKQLAALDETKRKLDADETALKARAQAIGGGEKRSRTGVVVVALAESATPSVGLTYLVRDATWRPSYALRAATDLSGLEVEYDAAIIQRTGEDWNNVALTLSTAQPARSASPAELPPVVVARQSTVRSAAAESAPATKAPSLGRVSVEKAMTDEHAAHAAELASTDAHVDQNATVATFALPRAVTFPSDASREQRTRIATVALKPEYVYVARPAVDTDVFLRGLTRNSSGYQFLAGRATVFFGNDSVGSIHIGDVAPGAEVELWFGPDRRITAKRTLVSRKQSETGLISKASELALNYKVELTNTMTKPVTVELWDRMPVSQDEDIVVTLSDVQPALSKDPSYENKERKSGLLKWTLQLPARGPDDTPQPTLVRWNVAVSWPKGAAITWFPE